MGHEMRGLAGTLGWAWWRCDGWWVARPGRREWRWGEGPSLAITTMFF